VEHKIYLILYAGSMLVRREHRGEEDVLVYQGRSETLQDKMSSCELSKFVPAMFASKSYQGTGLGLFISKYIIEFHGGSNMRAKNNTEDEGDKGATFAFTLPLIEHNMGSR
jgi:light-regulated signal transduction histidine kinase (bacteriophytochrome)